jgi:hypothetical protein
MPTRAICKDAFRRPGVPHFNPHSFQLEQEAVEPIGVLGQVNMSRFDFGRLGHHPIGFAAVRFLADRMGHARRRSVVQVLEQCQARSGVFNQDCLGAVLRSKACDLAPQIRILQAVAENIGEVIIPSDGIVTRLGLRLR